MNLDGEQNKILNLDRGKHVVQAPAGCGKTEILAQRIGIAITSGVASKDIVCLTFTNKAASEMQERYKTEDSDFSGFIGNIHNYCSEFLKRNGLISGSATLMGEDDLDDIIDGIIKKKNTVFDIKRGDFIQYTMDYKRSLHGLKPIFSEAFEGQNRNPNKKRALDELHGIYEGVKHNFDLVDFDDLLTLTIHALRTNSDLEFSRFKWVQVDESQDLNLAQWEIIDEISKNSDCIVFFGDYEQSIYSFLGTEEGRFYSLFGSSEYENHFLSKNYRSSSGIITVLNNYLKRTIGSEVTFIQDKIEETDGALEVIGVSGRLENELEKVASVTKALMNEYDNIGILCRNNKTADLCSDELIEIGIDHVKLSGQNIFQSKELKFCFAVLNAIRNPFDILSWSRIVGKTNSGMTLSDARSFLHRALRVGLTPDDLLEDEVKSQFAKFCDSFENERIVVFDTETTSLNTDKGEIIQIAAVELLNGEIGESFEVYIRQEKPLDAEIIKLTGITNEKLEADGVYPDQAIVQFLNFLGEHSTILAHNLDYDVSILESYVGRYSTFDTSKHFGQSFDSLILSKFLYKGLPQYKLEFLIEKFDLEGEGFHNAMNDVLATISLVMKIYVDAKEKRDSYKDFVLKEASVISRFKRNFIETYQRLRSNYFESTSIADVIDRLIEDHFQTDITDKDVYNCLIQFIRNLEESTEFRSLRMRLDEDLYKIMTLKESDLISDDARVVVSTVHKSKGLSFDGVVIVESIKGIYPNWRAEKEPDQEKRQKIINEDKRLLYVAMSRARKKIIVTYHDTFVSGYGNFYDRELTPFLLPIKDHYIEKKM